MSEDTTVVDSLVANEFEIEIEGEKLAGVFRLSGLVSFKLDGTSENNMRAVHEPFTLVKMVQRDGNNLFNKWLRESTDATAGSDRPRRTLAVVAIDDGVEIRRWTLNGAWIAAVSYSDFDTGSSEMIEETVTVHYDDLVETWSATPDLE